MTHLDCCYIQYKTCKSQENMDWESPWSGCPCCYYCQSPRQYAEKTFALALARIRSCRISENICFHLFIWPWNYLFLRSSTPEAIFKNTCFQWLQWSVSCELISKTWWNFYIFSWKSCHVKKTSVGFGNAACVILILDWEKWQLSNCFCVFW